MIIRHILALALLIGGLPAFGAYAVVAHTAAVSSNGGNSVTTSAINTTGANLLLACATKFNNNAPTMSDSKSNTWTALTIRGTATSAMSQIYYSVPTSVGSGHTFTFTDSGTFPSVGIVAVSGATATPFDAESGTASSSNGTSVQPGSITPAQANEFLFACGTVGNAYTGPGVDSSFTVSDSQAYSSGQGLGGIYTYRIETTLTAVNPTISWTTANNTSASMAAFKALNVITFQGITYNGMPNQSLIQGQLGGGVSVTAQTAAISTTTLCGTTSCPAGQYRITAYLTSTTTCSVAGPGAVGATLTWTDETGTKTAQTLPLSDNNALTFSSTLGLGVATNYAQGDITIWTSGANPVQYATTYTACTTGTGTYTLRLATERLQ
jgi:hypothetical protein